MQRHPIALSAGTLAVWCINRDGEKGHLAEPPASPSVGYGVCYTARIRHPVTLFTARQGLNLAMGIPDRKNWGTLVRPVEVRADGVVWLLDVREPGQTEARQVHFLVGPRTAKLLLKRHTYEVLRWENAVWVSRGGVGRGGAGRGAKGMQRQVYVR